MKKPAAFGSQVNGKGPVHSAAIETRLFGDVMNIVKHLVITRYDDGSPRWPGSMILRAESTLFKLIMKEPSAQLQLTAVAATLDDVFACMDLLLGCEDPPWQDDPNSWTPKQRGKKSG